MRVVVEAFDEPITVDLAADGHEARPRSEDAEARAELDERFTSRVGVDELLHARARPTAPHVALGSVGSVDDALLAKRQRHRDLVPVALGAKTHFGRKVVPKATDQTHARAVGDREGRTREDTLDAFAELDAQVAQHRPTGFGQEAEHRT